MFLFFIPLDYLCFVTSFTIPFPFAWIFFYCYIFFTIIVLVFLEITAYNFWIVKSKIIYNFLLFLDNARNSEHLKSIYPLNLYATVVNYFIFIF